MILLYYMCLLPIACGWQVIYLECEPKCIAILAQGLRPAGLPADSDFQKAMSQPMEVDQAASSTPEHKGKGGNLLKGTSEYFENKYKAAAVKETEIHLCLATDSSLPKESEGDMMITRTLMDSMEPEAHANVILATDFDHPGAFENPELTEALRKMTLSDTESWEEVDKATDTSSEADKSWAKVRYTDAMEVSVEGAGASGPAAQDKDSHRSRSPRAPEIQGYRGGAGLGRGVPPKRFEAAGTIEAQPRPLSLRRVGTSELYRVTSLPDSFPYLDDDTRRLTQGMTEKEFGSLFLHFSVGALDSIVVKRIIETYKVQKSRQTMQNILKQPHRRTGDRAGIGAKPLNEITSEESRPHIVCGDCGQEWKQTSKKCWVCGSQRPMTREEYEKVEADSQLVKIDGKLWRLTLEGGGVKWQSMEAGEPENQTKQGQVDGCSLAEAPPCPMLETEEDMGELTMADQISMNHRVHIRQEIVKHKPEREDQDSVIRARAKTTEDIDPSQSFHLWRPEYEKAERLQTEIMSAGGTKQKKDQQAASARREVEAVKLATQSIQAQQAFLADFQEGMLEVDEGEISNPMVKTF